MIVTKFTKFIFRQFLHSSEILLGMERPIRIIRVRTSSGSKIKRVVLDLRCQFLARRNNLNVIVLTQSTGMGKIYGSGSPELFLVLFLKLTGIEAGYDSYELHFLERLGENWVIKEFSRRYVGSETYRESRCA